MGVIGEIFTAAPDGMRRAAVLKLAAQGPIHRVMLRNGIPGWFVTGNAEARLALTDPRLVRSPAGMSFAKDLPEIVAKLHNHMLSQNPPDHTRLRKLVTSAFTRRRIESLVPQVEALARELIDEMSEAVDHGDAVDLLPAYAYPLPFRVICALLGIHQYDEKQLGAWFTTMAAGAATTLEAYADAANNVLRFLQDLVGLKRREPGDDLISDLIHARDGDDRLTENELTAMCFLLFNAGYETTTGLISSSVLALLRHPDQMELLRSQPELVDSVVEEVLRFDSVALSTFPAVATETFNLGDHLIHAGEVVTVSPLAVGLDPALNEDPDRFDITRDAAHLAFGHGIHYCLGAPLARMEARIALRFLFERFPALKLAGEDLERLPSLLFNRLTSLPVRTFH